MLRRSAFAIVTLTIMANPSAADTVLLHAAACEVR
jgi:hypothetical protein